MISEEFEERIIEEIESSGIRSQALKDDLIDHFCCLVEMFMAKGNDFERSLALAYEQTAPNGLDEIQKETIFLLNYSKIMFTKRLIYVSGYLFSILWITGALFKILHLQGAGFLLGVGGIGLALIFFPLLFLSRYKFWVREVLSERLKWIIGSISIMLLVIAISMKMLQLMGAAFMLGASFLVFGFGFLPFLFFKMYHRSLNEV